MIKSILIITLLFFQNTFCQEYFFDFLLEHKYTSNSSTNFYLINSKDDSYYIGIYFGRETTYGKIFDFKRNIIHEYEVINLENSYKFNYMYSINTNFKKWNNNFVIESFEKIIDSTHIEYKINVFKNKRKKKIESEIVVLIENSNDLFNNDILNGLSHGRLRNKGFKIDKGTLLNFKVKFENQNKFEIKLNKKQKINTLITLSKEQLIYK